MTQTEAELRERVASEVKASLARILSRLEQAGASRALRDQVADLSRTARAELTADRAAREAEIEALCDLEPPEVIRYAELLIRARYSPISPLYAIWGKIADDLNTVSHLPGRGDWGQQMRDIMRFNDAQAMAWAIIDQFHGYHGARAPR
jgi:hypothetical protein